jgi:hypothetical protein
MNEKDVEFEQRCDELEREIHILKRHLRISSRCWVISAVAWFALGSLSVALRLMECP